ncbi:MAG TPA: DUF6580 family putative transport protein [Flavisolibacter sp.]|jgi:hypothetical protein|nr:DUF6580 family putative transport protein [Flavisolibacter sp.]
MKLKKSVLLAFVLLIVVGSVCRVMGFAPQIAMAVFGAVVIRDKRLALILPLVSMLLSDVLFQVLFTYGLKEYGGFYEGQLTNYIVLALSGLVGFWARNMNWGRIAAVSVAAPTLFFFLSNFAVWIGGGGLQRPKTFDGLLMTYADGIPFFRSGLAYTILFSALLFGGYFLLQRYLASRKQLA